MGAKHCTTENAIALRCGGVVAAVALPCGRILPTMSALRRWFQTYWGGAAVAALTGMALAALLLYAPGDRWKLIPLIGAAVLLLAWWFHPARRHYRMAVSCLGIGAAGGFSLIARAVIVPEQAGPAEFILDSSPWALEFGIAGACFFGWLELAEARALFSLFCAQRRDREPDEDKRAKLPSALPTDAVADEITAWLGGPALRVARHPRHPLRRLPGAVAEPARPMRGSDLHRPALQLQPQLLWWGEVFWGESPPTKEKRSFDDRHASTQASIDSMRPRCQQLARVLKPTESFYCHCDWHATKCVKFSPSRFGGMES
jgi:hypothetical protein